MKISLQGFVHLPDTVDVGSFYNPLVARHSSSRPSQGVCGAFRAAEKRLQAAQWAIHSIVCPARGRPVPPGCHVKISLVAGQGVQLVHASQGELLEESRRSLSDVIVPLFHADDRETCLFKVPLQRIRGEIVDMIGRIRPFHRLLGVALQVGVGRHPSYDQNAYVLLFRALES